MDLRVFRRRKSDEIERAAERFLAAARQPVAPEGLRQHGFSRVMERARAEIPQGKAWALPVYARPALRAALVALFALIFLSGSTAALYAASYRALPDSSLYGVKIAFERARVALSFSDSSRLELEMELGRRRLEEVREMGRLGRVRGAERWLKEYGRCLTHIENRVASLGEGEEAHRWRWRVALHLEEQENRLGEILEEAPEGLVPWLEEATRRCVALRAGVRREYERSGHDEKGPGTVEGDSGASGQTHREPSSGEGGTTPQPSDDTKQGETPQEKHNPAPFGDAPYTSGKGEGERRRGP